MGAACSASESGPPGDVNGECLSARREAKARGLQGLERETTEQDSEDDSDASEEDAQEEQQLSAPPQQEPQPVAALQASGPPRVSRGAPPTLRVVGGHSVQLRPLSPAHVALGMAPRIQQPAPPQRPAASPPPARPSETSPAAAAASSSAGDQESDLLERYPKGNNSLDELANGVPLVSLGCYCGPKLSFQKMGRGAATLPFDWIRTTVDGLLHYIRSDYSGFFDFTTKLPVPGCTRMVMYRDALHSFWHDDPEDPAMRERYTRRIERFNQLDARSRPILFVRSVVTTEEVLRARELADVLVARFGKEARLLMILNFQEKTTGPALVRGLPNLMVYYLSAEVHRKTSPEFQAPFAGAVRCGLDWALGRDVKAAVFNSPQAARQAADADGSGYNGLGGLDAFEASGGRECGVSEGPCVGKGMTVVRYPAAQGRMGVQIPLAMNSLHAAMA